MRDRAGFNLWANEYDDFVVSSYKKGTYPFAGYFDILNYIYKKVTKVKKAKVLDLGFGTGRLTSKLYDAGCEIYGQDFSQNMISIAAKKMRNAHLFKGDFTEGLAEPLLHQKYDFIIATYSLHHMPDEKKPDFIRTLLDLLKEGGSIYVGDIAFSSSYVMNAIKETVGDEWDDAEHYHAVDQIKKEIPRVKFKQLSFCSGVIEIKNDKKANYRKAIAKDKPIIESLYIQMLQTIYKTDKVDPYTVGYLDKFFLGTGSWISVAEYNGKVIGYLSIEEYHDIDREYLYLDDFCVDSDYRCQGIGSALLETAEKYAKKKSIRNVDLHVDFKNPRAFDFYKKHGYSEVKKEKTRYKMNKRVL